MVRGFAELCCDVDSELGRLSPSYGYEHFRVTEAQRFVIWHVVWRQLVAFLTGRVHLLLGLLCLARLGALGRS